MGHFKNLLIQAEQLAQDNFNMGRNEFCALAADTFKSHFGFNNMMRASVEHYDRIQIDLNDHYDRMAEEAEYNRQLKQFNEFFGEYNDQL